MLLNGHLGRVLNCPISSPPLIAYGVDRNGVGYFVTERTSGKPLSRKRIDIEMISIIFTGMLEEVSALHAGGLGSGTLCEDSFLVDAALGVSFVGLMPALPSDSQQTKLKLSDSIHSCIAPEQRAGKSGGQAADVYALGALLYRMIAKRSLPATAGEHQHFEHLRALGSTLFKTCPQLVWMQPVLEKSLRWKPENRYANASEFLNDLKKKRPASDSNFRRNARIFEAVLTEYLLSPTAKVISVAAIVLISFGLLYERASEKLQLDNVTSNSLPSSSSLNHNPTRADVRVVSGLKNPTRSTGAKKKSLWDYLSDDEETEYDTSDLGANIQFGRHEALSNTDREYPTNESEATANSEDTKSQATRTTTVRRFTRSSSKPTPPKPRPIRKPRTAKPTKILRGDTPSKSWLDSGSALGNLLTHGSVLAPKRIPWCVNNRRLRRRSR